MNKTIITIGREKGSGGHYIGDLLAQRLGVKCYDKELLVETAKTSGFSEQFIAEYEEKSRPVCSTRWLPVSIQVHTVIHCINRFSWRRAR